MAINIQSLTIFFLYVKFIMNILKKTFIILILTFDNESDNETQNKNIILSPSPFP